MKYWRRHKHELEADPTSSTSTNPSSGAHPNQTEQPLPEGPPQKRKRYDHDDDMLLAQYFATGPQGTSDAIFQRFARLHPHHPWKGWQEHHRIHKTQIDHLMKGVLQGEGVGMNMGMGMGVGVGVGVNVGVGVDDALQPFALESMEA